MDKLDRVQLVEMVIGLYFTLEARANCPDCGGSGGQWVAVGIGEDDIDYKICQCQIDAEKVLEGLKAPHDTLLGEYLRNKGYDLAEITQTIGDEARATLKTLAHQLFTSEADNG